MDRRTTCHDSTDDAPHDMAALQILISSSSGAPSAELGSHTRRRANCCITWGSECSHRVNLMDESMGWPNHSMPRSIATIVPSHDQHSYAMKRSPVAWIMTDDPYPQSAYNICCLGHLVLFGHYAFPAPAGEDRNPHGDFPFDEPEWLHCRLRSHGQTDPTSSASWARPIRRALQQRVYDSNHHSSVP